LIASHSSDLGSKQEQREVVVAQGVCQEFGEGSYDWDRCCRWNYIENVSSFWVDSHTVVPLYTCFGYQYGLVGLWKEQHEVAAVSGVPQSDRCV